MLPSSVQNGKYQRKSQAPPGVSEADLSGSSFLPFFHSFMLNGGSWFLCNLCSTGLFVWKHNIWSHLFFPLSLPPPFPLSPLGVQITHTSLLSRLGKAKCRPDNYESKTYNKELKNLQAQDSLFCFVLFYS